MDEALCKGKHEDLWFPPLPGDRPYPENDYHNIAKMVCEHCPVRPQCERLGADEEYGVWGGTDPKDRKEGKEPTLPPYKLIPRYLTMVPDHDPSLKLDIPALFTDLKRYSDKRA